MSRTTATGGVARAEAKGDVRTALTAIRELTRLMELKARVMGEIRDREIKITNVQIDLATAEKMATIFLARRRAAALSSGTRPVEVSQTAAKDEE